MSLLPTFEPSPSSNPAVRDLVVLVALAGTSGGALVAHLTWDLSLTWLAGFVVFPASAFVVLLAFVGRGRADRAGLFSDRLVAGAAFGLVATLVYDAARPLLVTGFGLDFNPYRAHPIFGSLITGRPSTDGVAVAVGWAYHFWNGISFGMMFALLRPRGRWLAGLLWAETLQLFMMALYPRFLEVRLEDPGFLFTGLIGHGLYGIVLGTLLARWGPPVAAPPGTGAHRLATFGQRPVSVGRPEGGSS
jgi:hypothetical protein